MSIYWDITCCRRRLWPVVITNTSARKSLSGCRRPLHPSDFALATIAPGKILSVSTVDNDTFDTSLDHPAQGTLRECQEYPQTDRLDNVCDL